MTEGTRDRDPDAFIVMHTPKDGLAPYGVGPFPPLDDLAAGLITHPTCDCVLTIIWIGFPTGIRMALAIDEEAIKEMVAHFDETTDLLN